MNKKNPKTFKVVARVDKKQRAKINKMIERSEGYVTQTDIMSRAFDLYDWASERYPIGIDLMPQIPQLVNDRRSAAKAPKQGKKRP